MKMSAPSADTPLQNSGHEIENIVVALDSSTGSSHVISTAARFSRAVPAATVHVVHVFKTSRIDHARAGVPRNDTDAIADSKDQLEAYVSNTKAQCRNEVVGHFVVGDPTTEILKTLDQTKADLLVVGTHDYRGFERWLLGSTSETLMRKAPCSTLVVRPPRVV
jgi:nucleotide-binding universal stress UspA family protein